MANVLTDRRDGIRMAAAYPVRIIDRRGRLLVCGRTANISENGVYAIFNRRTMPDNGLIELEIEVPAVSGKPGRGDAQRIVRYSARIVRDQTVGQMMGLGIQFVRKLN